MTSLDIQQSYRTFGALYAVLIVTVVLTRSLAADQLLVGVAVAVGFGGLGLAVFWRLGDARRTGVSGRLEASIGSWRIDRAAIERAARLGTAGVWFLGVLLLDSFGVRLGALGIAAVTVLNCVVLWKAAVAIPAVETWIGGET